jgi:hypothetical protein
MSHVSRFLTNGGKKMRLCIALALVLVLATSAFALEKKAYQIREDYDTEPLYDTALQYYYYIPCPTYSWFWVFTGWSVGDIIGVCFEIGDEGTGCYEPADPYNCHTLEILRILDFAGYGTIYPGLFTVQFDVFCVPEYCCSPIAPDPLWYPPGMHLYSSGCNVEFHFGWNYYYFDPVVCITPCCVVPGPPPGYPVILITATMCGTQGIYPAWGWDNISTPISTGCIMHDICCMPVVYPRWPCDTYDPLPQVHSGYIGTYFFEYWPPLCFQDGADTNFHFGCIELAWRIYLICEGPTAAQPSTWGNIKSIYK